MKHSEITRTAHPFQNGTGALDVADEGDDGRAAVAGNACNTLKAGHQGIKLRVYQVPCPQPTAAKKEVRCMTIFGRGLQGSGEV